MSGRAAFRVGGRVQSNPAHAHLFDGTPWKAKLELQRGGTIECVPLATQTSEDGQGTLLVRWDSLTDQPNLGPAWLHWVHSSLVVPA